MEETFLFVKEQVLPHWPFLVTTLIFTVIGRFTSTKVFTRTRAYEKQSDKWYKFWENQWFWWWGRETLALHPILTGCVLGLMWRNPEFADPAWPWTADVAYFAGAGVASLFAWNLLKSFAKKRGITLTLPGGSERPGESPPDFVPNAMPEDDPEEYEVEENIEDRLF